jgi:hypothetical protein
MMQIFKIIVYTLKLCVFVENRFYIPNNNNNSVLGCQYKQAVEGSACVAYNILGISFAIFEVFF